MIASSIRRRAVRAVFVMLFGMFMPGMLVQAPPTVAARVGPRAAPGVLAYVLSNDASGDEIWFARADGTERRRVFSTGVPDPHQILDIGSLSWKKDGTGLAFDSNHERECSFYERDIFAVRILGGGYRRITQAPACRELDAYPQGSVTVPVENNSDESVVAFVYFQGAQTVKQVSLPPRGTGSVVFEQVADLLGLDLQAAVTIKGSGRESSFSSADIIPSAHVTAQPALLVGGAGLPDYGPAWPTWHYNGDHLAYSLAGGLLHRIMAQPAPLQPGVPLLHEHADTPVFATALEYGPTPARANQFLYLGWDVTDEPGVYLATEGSMNPGQKLVSLACCDQFTGLAWLPDGSGFVYSRLESNEIFEWKRANVYEYSFATGESTRRSDLPDGAFAQDLSVSLDGQLIAFEVSSQADGGPYDLWLMNRDGSDLHMFHAGASSPAWSPVELPPIYSLHLPFITR